MTTPKPDDLPTTPPERPQRGDKVNRPRRPAQCPGWPYWVAVTCLRGHKRGTFRYRRPKLVWGWGSGPEYGTPLRWVRLNKAVPVWTVIAPVDEYDRPCPCGARTVITENVPAPPKPRTPTRCAWAKTGSTCRCADGPHNHGGGRW